MSFKDEQVLNILRNAFELSHLITINMTGNILDSLKYDNSEIISEVVTQINEKKKN